MSRRAFLSFPGLRAKELKEKVTAKAPGPVSPTTRRGAIPMHRPPGAIEEGLFLERCTKCGECAKACPHDAIVEAPARFRHAAKTPMINPAEAPCYMCADFPCQTACPEHILMKELPVRMGTARIQSMDCLAYKNQTCTVCSEHCPVPGAIRMDEGKLIIDEGTCTGCGVCVYVCPAPQNAILFLPAMMRPAAP